MVVRRLLLGLLLVCQAAVAQPGDPHADFTRELTAIREEAYVTPRAALRRLDVLRQGHTGRELGQVLVVTSGAYWWLKDMNRAVDAALGAERLGRELHDDDLLAQAMLHHAYALSKYVHDQEAARRLVQGAARLADDTADPYLKTEALVTQGMLAEEDGDTPGGIELVTRAVDVARAGNDPDALQMALREQARLLAGVGKFTEALARTDEMIAAARARGIPGQLAHARLAEYATAARAGNPKRAESALRAAVDLLEKLDAQERLAVPLANLSELYMQGRRYGEAERAATKALRISRAVGDDYGIRLATFELGLTQIYFRNIAEGRAMADKALEALKNDDQYVRMLLNYGHALGQVGFGEAALTIYEKAGSVSLAAWRKEKELSYEALQRARDNQKKQSELAALHHESVLKAAELKGARRQRSLWVALSATTCVAVVLIAFLYGRVAKANKALKQKNEQLFMQSTRDSLTGLFNRHYFYEQVVPRHHRQAGAASDRRAGGEGRTGGVFLLMDIDRFKSINDTLGHGAGDVVLKNVAARLAATLREQDVLIRWGGEEFLAYLPGIGTEEARQVCARVLAAVGGTPIALDDRELTATISIGFCPKALHPDAHDPDWEQLVHLADLCLYAAKTGGRNQAVGILDAGVLAPHVIAAADADLKRSAADGHLALLTVRGPAAVPARAAA
ncbi:diguanylate cyclase [Massilia sp. Root335]|uniref:tetratricopeptide repeat-containing diguanylate cyclase n=1 Tax=Massilia sp. Root335 TaxID=1736517 RepID=UPI0009EA7885|nr:diguanylate cyclase [Massilia sp. Root335]